MRWLSVIALATLIGTVAAASPPRGPVIELPLLVEATVCVEAATGCPDPDDVLRLTIDGDERRVGVVDLTVVQGSQTSGTILAELRVCPVRLLGPAQELAKLEPGVPLRMRAILRLGARYVLVESFAPLRER